VLACEIEAYCAEAGIASYRCSSHGCAADIQLRDVDFAISLGGDGTVLSTARMLSRFGVPIFPVNLGSFGFITEVGAEDWREDLSQFLEGKLPVFGRLMFQVQVLRKELVVFQESALNEAVISGGGISKLLRLNVSLRNGSLGLYRADGMIIATPTGSTAYSLAAGGPILQPELEAIILNPICPFTLSHRPIVLPGWEEVCVRVDEGQRTSVILTIDGQLDFPLLEGDDIRVSAAPFKAQILCSHKRSFYEVLKHKLNWSGGPDAGRTHNPEPGTH